CVLVLPAHPDAVSLSLHDALPIYRYGKRANHPDVDAAVVAGAAAADVEILVQRKWEHGPDQIDQAQTLGALDLAAQHVGEHERRVLVRSEERRVGKECRCGWSVDDDR